MRLWAMVPWLLVVTCCLTSQKVLAGTKDDSYNLYSDLFTVSNYNKEVRPSANASESLFIYLGFNLLSLVSVEEKDQTLRTIARLDLSWSDYLLSWDPSSYGDIDTILVKQEKIWLPDVVVGNSVKSHKQLGFDELPVRLFDSGDIFWAPSDLIATSCSIDVTYYPFDTQVCHIDFETSMSSYEEVDINIDRTVPVSLVDYSEDGQWELVDTDAVNLSNEDSKTKIRFSLLLKRRRAFYIVNIIAPVLFLSLTASLVFALPADAGEKMGMSITVLLAFAVYLTIVSDVLPQTSVQISILALYLTILLGFTALSVVTSVFILRLHHKPDEDPVGHKTAKLTLLLSKLMCRSLDKAEQTPPKKNTVAPEKLGYPYDDDDPGSVPSAPPVYSAPITWQDVSKTLDWFLFLMFSGLSLLVTIVFLLALAIGSESASPSLNKAPVVK